MAQQEEDKAPLKIAPCIHAGVDLHAAREEDYEEEEQDEWRQGEDDGGDAEKKRAALARRQRARRVAASLIEFIASTDFSVGLDMLANADDLHLASMLEAYAGAYPGDTRPWAAPADDFGGGAGGAAGGDGDAMATDDNK